MAMNVAPFQSTDEFTMAGFNSKIAEINSGVNTEVDGQIGDIKFSARNITDPKWHKCDGSMFPYTGNEALTSLNLSNKFNVEAIKMFNLDTVNSIIYSVCCYDGGYALCVRQGSSQYFVLTEDFKTAKAVYDITSIGAYWNGYGKVFYRNNQFILFTYVNSSNHGIFTSQTGESWELKVSYSNTNKSYPCMTYGYDHNFIYSNGKYYCNLPFGDSNNLVYLYYSEDLITWNSLTIDMSVPVCAGGMTIGNGYIVIGFCANRDVYAAYVSEDSLAKLAYKSLLSVSSNVGLAAPIIQFLNSTFYCFVGYSQSGSLYHYIIEWSDWSVITKRSVYNSLSSTEYALVTNHDYMLWTNDTQLAVLIRNNKLYLISGNKGYIYDTELRTVQWFSVPVGSASGQCCCSDSNRFVSINSSYSQVVGGASTNNFFVGYFVDNQLPSLDYGYIKISN